MPLSSLLDRGPADLGPLADGDRLTLSSLEPHEAASVAEAVCAMSPWSRYPYPSEAMTSFLLRREPAAPRISLRVGGSLAGAAVVRLEWLRGPYIQLLAVTSPHHNKGAGSRFLEWLEREARQEGERNLWVCAASFNEGALRHYERFGFRRVAQLDEVVRDGFDEVLLRKRLA